MPGWEQGASSPTPTLLLPPTGHQHVHGLPSATSRCLRSLQTWLRSWPVATGPWSLHPPPASAASLVPTACCLTALLQPVAPRHPRHQPALVKWSRT